MEYNIRDFKRQKMIEKGGFGQVCLYKHKVRDETIAVKEINISDDKVKETTEREIEIMSYLRHPTIMKCLGHQYSENGQTLYILMHYMQNMSLQNILKKQPADFDNTNRQIILIGIAYGMNFLHNHLIINRDLKPLNILLDDNYCPIITDFGLSKKVDILVTHQQSISTSTIDYMAPEFIKAAESKIDSIDGIMNDAYTFSVDVYSFAILMFQVVTNAVTPYDDLTGVQLFARMAKSDENNPIRPIFPEDIKPSFKELIEKCWSHDPNNRPTFDEIYNELTSFIHNDKNIITENDCCFDKGVNIDKVKEYIDNINVSREDNPIFQNMEIGIQNLLKQKKEFKKEIQELNDKIKELDEISQKNTSISDTNNYGLQCNEKLSILKIMTIDTFNSLPFHMQKLIITQISEIFKKSKQNTSFCKKIANLIDYLFKKKYQMIANVLKY